MLHRKELLHLNTQASNPLHCVLQKVYVSSSAVLQPKVKPECFPLSLTVSLFGFGIYESQYFPLEATGLVFTIKATEAEFDFKSVPIKFAILKISSETKG